MRILVTETRPGAAAKIEAEALARGFSVARCRTADGAAQGQVDSPCVGVSGAAPCPLTRHVDVAIDVHGERPDGVSAGEFGAVCAMQARIPIVVVGDNPFGAAAENASEGDAIDVAVQAGSHAAGRPPIDVVVSQVRRVLYDAGGRQNVTWAGYVETAGGFDVVIELSQAIAQSLRDRLDADLLPLFWQAHAAYRFGRVIYENQ